MFHNRMNKYRFLTQEVSEIAYKYIYYMKIVSFKKIIFIYINYKMCIHFINYFNFINIVKLKTF